MFAGLQVEKKPETQFSGDMVDSQKHLNIKEKTTCLDYGIIILRGHQDALQKIR